MHRALREHPPRADGIRTPEDSACFAATTFSRKVKHHLAPDDSYTHNMARWQHSPADDFPMAGTSVRRYAVIDPAARTLIHYRLNEEDEYGQSQAFGEGDTMAFDALPTITVPIAQLFAGAPDTTLRITVA